MTVRELIESLLVLDPEREVYLDSLQFGFFFAAKCATAIEVREDGEVYIV